MWSEVRNFVPDDKRPEIAAKILNMFWNKDADCWEDNMNIVKDSKSVLGNMLEDA